MSTSNFSLYRTATSEEVLSVTVEPAHLPGDVSKVAAVLTQLYEQQDSVYAWLQDYFAVNVAALVPEKLGLALAAAFIDQRIAHDRDFKLQANAILKASGEVQMPIATQSFDEVVAMWTSPHLRAEVLGLLCNFAARGKLFGAAHGDTGQRDYIRTMLRLSSDCLSVAREHASRTTDILVWLAYEHLRLTLTVEGMSHPRVWRLLGDLTSDVYSLGIHKESVDTVTAPVFLTELRRRCFAKVYIVDKLVSSVLDRPPRVLRRFASCHLPLDISDDQLLGDVEAFEQGRAMLSEHGWATDGKYRNATWLRMFYIIYSVREHMLEYHFRLLSDSDTEELLALSERAKQAWTSIPSHLRESDLTAPVPVRNMLTVTKLAYLYNIFQIQHIMESVNRGRSGHLLEAAMHMLETVVQVGTERTRTGSVTHNFEYVALYYGMPAAAVLAAHLSGSAPPQDMPSTVSRARLIRELSVFLAYVDSTFREDNVNFAAVKQASIAMSRTLNAALEPTKSPEGEFSSTPRLGWEHNATTQMNPSDNLSSVLSSEDTQLTTTGFPSSLPMDDFVLDEWIQNIDWTATGSDWGYF